jgi:hypothetical protein
MKIFTFTYQHILKIEAFFRNMFIMLLFEDALSNVGENILSFFFPIIKSTKWFFR